MTETQQILLRLAAAALGGLAVGIEREWSARRDGDHSRFGGVRTFLLLGLAGGLAAAVGREDPRLGLVMLAGAAALVVVAYLVSAWKGTIDATTEVAAVVVLGAGLLAGTGRLVLASAVFAATALVLAEKGRMHAAVERIQSAELEAGARFAVLALVVLPLLPAEPWGPYGGIEPRRLWILVLIFAGLSFAGYIALRVAGPERGYGLAGLLGGVVSSTAVTLNFARESRGHDRLARALGVGVLAASAVLPVRVLVLSGVLNLEVARALVPALLPAILAGAGAVLLALRSRDRNATREEVLPGNPLRLTAAIQMTLLFVAMLWLLAAVRDRFGSAGLLGTSALLGLTDLDALTYSMSKLAASGTPAATAVHALLIGMISNTAFKAVLAAILGSPGFRRVSLIGLAVFGAALGAGFLLT
ncbi:MAG: hypothetical protein H6Q03_2919 [Acidobacteria bacterium]|nr:hypothetical protein [Acidobacteriota bacterium]